LNADSYFETLIPPLKAYYEEKMAKTLKNSPCLADDVHVEVSFTEVAAGEETALDCPEK